jgi:hypothetical protein
MLAKVPQEGTAPELSLPCVNCCSKMYLEPPTTLEKERHRDRYKREREGQRKRERERKRDLKWM